LAALYNRKGEPDRARETAERGLALLDDAKDDASPWLRWLLVQRGRAYVKEGEAELAKADCARALALQEKGGIGPDRVYAPDALTCLGEAQRALEERAAAIAVLERSVLLERRIDRGDLALARFALARALSRSAADRSRAHGLAQQAFDGLRALRGREREVGAIDQWLQEEH
jgi:hypothetical protein